MAKNQTIETEASVTDFINSIADEAKRNDSFQLTKLTEEITRFPAKMWGPAIIGFGTYHYKYESGREGDMALISFSPRKSSLTLYMGSRKEELLKALGKHKISGGCVHIVKLTDVNMAVLKDFIADSFALSKQKHLGH